MRFTLALLGSLALFVAGLVQGTNARDYPPPPQAQDVSHCSWSPAESQAHYLSLSFSVEEGSRPRCCPNWFHHLIQGEGPAPLQQREEDRSPCITDCLRLMPTTLYISKLFDVKILCSLLSCVLAYVSVVS